MKLFQRTGHKTSYIVILLWSLIFAKCFTLEYLVQAYTVPINSALYVWCLTLLMATTATFVLLRIQASEDRIQNIRRHDLLIWSTCGTGIVLTFALMIQSQHISHYILPALFAAILGAAYISHGLLNNKRIHTLSGIGWSIGAGILFLFAHNSATSLLLFAALIIALTSIPTLFRILKK